jgi:flagellar basal-body rod protein FlgB
MSSIDTYFGIHAAALQARAQRLDLLASNIANAATPGYKARDLDFAQMLSGSHGPALAIDAPGQIAVSVAGPQVSAKYRVPVQSSLDGNTVELSTEQTLFAENAVRYQSSLSFINGRIAQLNAALKGE